MTNGPGDTTLGSGTRLRLLDVVAQSVGFMGPVFSIAFLVPLVMGLTSVTGNGAGAAAPLAVVVASVGVLGFGWIVAQYARRIHAAGALYDYVTDGLGVRVGGAAGYVYYAGVVVLGAALLVMLGGTIHDTLDAEFGRPLLPELGWDLLLLAIVAVVVFLGVALSTRLQLVLAVVSIVVVGAFSLYVVVRVGADVDVAKAFTPSGSPQGLSGVLFGVVYAVLLFTGFETAANLGEETDNPARNLPRAVLFSILAVAGFYLLATYAQVAGFGFDLDAFGEAAGAPLFALASPAAAGGYGSVAMVRLMELVVVLDMLAVLVGCATAGSRGLFALARDGRLPRGLAAVSGRGTPAVAGVAVMLGYLAAVLVSAFWTSLWAVPEQPHYVSVFGVLATFGAFALALVYFLLSVGAFRGLAGHPNRPAVVTAAAVGTLVTGAAIFGAMYQAPALTLWTQLSCFAVFGIGLLVRGRNTVPERGTDFSGLAPADQGPVKL